MRIRGGVLREKPVARQSDNCRLVNVRRYQGATDTRRITALLRWRREPDLFQSKDKFVRINHRPDKVVRSASRGAKLFHNLSS